MSEMVERVARAITGPCLGNPEAMARAAIAAMQDLPEELGPRYSAGEYSRRNIEAMVEDALK